MDCLLKNDVDVKKWSHPGLVGGRSCRGEEVSKALSSRSPFLYHSQFSHTGISSSSSHNFLVSILPLTSMLQFCASHIYFSAPPPWREGTCSLHLPTLINLLRSSKQPQPHFSHLFSRVQRLILSTLEPLFPGWDLLSSQKSIALQIQQQHWHHTPFLWPADIKSEKQGCLKNLFVARIRAKLQHK